MSDAVLYLNCASGISGDMLVGALVSLGADAGKMREAVASLGLGPLEIETEEVDKGGVRAVRFNPVIPPDTPRQETLAEVEAVLARGNLPRETAELVLHVFMTLAEAEADAHGESPGKAHFHELGNPDTLVDVLCAVTGIHSLGVERIFASPVNLGSGTVRMAHGLYPVPAPAVANLLEGFDVFSDGEPGEKTTPTGAALLSALAVRGEIMPPVNLTAVGYGAGTADFTSSLNVLQAILGKPAPGPERGQSLVIECNIDDMNPQVYPYLIRRLLDAGAQDAFLVPVVMKKGRPGCVVSVVAPPDRADMLCELLLAESTTIGVRRWAVDRVKARRRAESMDTPWGAVSVKITEAGGRRRAVPEFEDCRRIADQTGQPLLEVMARLRSLAEERFAG